jgi:hypothetical protein
MFHFYLSPLLNLKNLSDDFLVVTSHGLPTTVRFKAHSLFPNTHFNTLWRLLMEALNHIRIDIHRQLALCFALRTFYVNLTNENLAIFPYSRRSHTYGDEDYISYIIYLLTSISLRAVTNTKPEQCLYGTIINNWLTKFRRKWSHPILTTLKPSGYYTGCGISQLTAAHFVGGHILGN